MLAQIIFLDNVFISVKSSRAYPNVTSSNPTSFSSSFVVMSWKIFRRLCYIPLVGPYTDSSLEDEWQNILKFLKESILFLDSVAKLSY
jgi:hypothetical protein